MRDNPMTTRLCAALGWVLLAAVPIVFAGTPISAQDPVAGGVGEAIEMEEVESTTPEVVLASFTTEIADREPVDTVSFLSNEKRVVYFFTDLRNLQNTQIKHVWSFQGKEMGTVRFYVKGSRWRVWSSKQLLPAWIGTWTVSVEGADDEVLASESFTYQEAP